MKQTAEYFSGRVEHTVGFIFSDYQFSMVLELSS